MYKTESPPYMTASDKVILFDGVCRLCNAWSQFIIKYDHNHLFKLASVQSEAGQSILTFLNMPTDHFDTMVYIESGKAYTRSDALIKITSQLDAPWRYFSIFRRLPIPLRDRLYDRIALNRYFLFGRYKQCLLPDPDHDQRFLNHGK